METASPTSDEKTMALLIHVLGIVTGFVGPLIIWLIKKGDSAFVDAHGRAALNWQITRVLALALAVGLGFTLILAPVGFLLILAVAILGVVFGIMGAVKANAGKLYTYPLTFKIL